MKIFLTGGTGFLGQYLCRVFIGKGHKVTMLVRKPVANNYFNQGISIISGDPLAEGDWQRQIAGHEAVVNLTGASIFQRWTKSVKKEILETRIISTSRIVDAMKKSRAKGVTLFNASGAGYYGPCGEPAINESVKSGNTFLARVASAWEQTALKAEDDGVRVILCRFGIVLGRHGGAFPRLMVLARFHACTPWGSGEQWFSWIHERDVAGIFEFLLEHNDIRGPVNFTSPLPVKNREMANILNGILKMNPLLPVMPAWFLRSILGEFSQVFLDGQRVLPDVLTKQGFVFKLPVLRDAAADLLQYEKNKA
ncbi:MAG: TIGR01777 family oxidoreductase [Proteobacteria bacterium]|nr:TIGR01777 family oxidoreductase [Pseudomonadota bacterium]